MMYISGVLHVFPLAPVSPEARGHDKLPNSVNSYFYAPTYCTPVCNTAYSSTTCAEHNAPVGVHGRPGRPGSCDSSVGQILEPLITVGHFFLCFLRVFESRAQKGRFSRDRQRFRSRVTSTTLHHIG